MKILALISGLGLILGSNSASISREIPSIFETDNPPCSSDPSGAFLDVIIMIDSSLNMGSLIKKVATTLSLVFSGFPIGNNWDITKEYKNTRIAVITYDETARIVANYSQINSIKDLSNVLNNIPISGTYTANIYDAFLKAFYMDTNCTDVFNCSICYDDRRPTAFMLFAASSNSPNMTKLADIVQESDFFDDGTFITVNFNPNDANLNSLLQTMTSDQQFGVSLYNYNVTSNSLAKDLSWALTQANCYCGDLGGNQIVFWDSTRNQYARSRECFYLNDWLGGEANDTVNMCSWPNLQIIPAFVLSANKTGYIQSTFVFYRLIRNLALFDPDGAYKFYIGLHQNSQGQWAWYDYNRNEFPLSGYIDWAQGQPSTGGCAVFTSDMNNNLVWQSATCDTKASGTNLVLCQKLACDTTSFSCCADCNGGETETCDVDFIAKKKKHSLKYNKKILKNY